MSTHLSDHEWHDITCYSRGEERVPRWWQYGNTTLRVGNDHVHFRSDPHWHFSFQGIQKAMCKLEDSTEEEFKKTALNRARAILKNQLKELD